MTKRTWGLLAVLAVVGIGSLGWLLYGQNFPEDATASVQQIQNEEDVSEDNDRAAEVAPVQPSQEQVALKTFTDAELGMSFQVPTGITVERSELDLTAKFPPFKGYHLRGEGYSGSLLINDPGRGFEEYEREIEKRTITIDGVTAKFSVLEGSYEEEKFRSAFVQFEYDGDRYFFILGYTTEEDREITDRIVATLSMK